MSAVRIATLGMANWYHAYPFAKIVSETPGAKLIAVTDDDEQRLAWIRERHPGVAIRPDYASILDDPDIDAVIINAVTSEHADLAVAAAAKGKHVLCDKPLEINLDRANKIVAAFHNTKLVFAAALTRRPRPINQMIRRIIQDGTIGEVLALIEVGRFGFPQSGPLTKAPGWYGNKALAGFGAFADFGTHEMDMACWLLGGKVKSVSGKLANLLHKVDEVDDYGIATLEFDSGAIATLESSWITHGPGTNSLFIQGTKGSIALEGSLKVNTAALNWEVNDTSKEYMNVHGINLRVDGFRQVLENFVACIRGEETVPYANLDDVIAVTRLLDAVSESDRTGKTASLKG